MDALKIQTNILKGWYKDKIHGAWVYRGEDYIDICPNGFVGYRIPKDKFFLDISKYTDVDRIDEYMNKAKGGDVATKVTIFDKPEGDKIAKALEISTYLRTAYVNYDLIKPFEGKGHTLAFTITDMLGPIGIWDNNGFVGMVMPFRYSEDGIETKKETERNYYE